MRMGIEDYPEFGVRRKSLGECSKDSANDVMMIEDDRKVVDFDAVKTAYLNEIGLSENCAKSVDAMFCDAKGMLHFVEFKNGEYKGTEIIQKAYDSVMMFCDITQRGISELRKASKFILVINQDKYERMSPSDKRALALASKGDVDFAVSGLSKMRGYLFESVWCIPIRRFEKYITKVEIA